MEFYAKRNGNAAYATKLYKLFTKNTTLLLKHPKLWQTLLYNYR